ncbi:MBL fold metallo-hydrolase [Nannocystis sp. SCPEA4]|uniref:MBL fold metallo-hydrolase n=1 Tax=Nannocystis sp. SCPEA4 TaxID=2996787 RepID=UPI00226E2C75|nr:MBL fold metallo-hydrolase [Nannocystis sp. SCPEA4]MCY1059363.1 MBL fold metallo-hydrolase [Nannocystis sp. SCPEA4]
METRVDEVADGIYRLNTRVPGFNFNQYLIVDDEPLLFHTGPRGLFESVRAAIARVIPLERLRWLGFSHVEADECGALNRFLAVAPQASPLCSKVAAMVSITDLADRPPRGLADGEQVSLGRRNVTWLDAPHVPHGWECGYLFERETRTLLCGDLFTQADGCDVPVTEGDILGPSEAFRLQMDYFAHARQQGAILERLAGTQPTTLACMHGSAWRGDGGALIRALAASLERQPQ